MSISQRINEELKEAMKQKNKLKLSVLRLLKASIKNREIEKGSSLNDEEILEVVQKEIKKRKESIEAYRKGGRGKLAQQEETEMAILYEFLPPQATEEEIEKVIRDIVSQIPDGTKINMGMIMPKAIQQLKGRADGKTISRIAKKFL